MDENSVRCYRQIGMSRYYTLLNADASYLPTTPEVGSGSCAYAVDTIRCFFYDVSTKSWYDPETGEIVAQG